MAKTFEKVSGEFASLTALRQNVELEIDATNTNFIELQALAREAARQAGEFAAGLRAIGNIGVKYEDFCKEKQVLAQLKLWKDQKTTALRLKPRFTSAEKEFQEVLKQITAMNAELEEEVTSREKKANRKIFKITSKSLPDLKALQTKVSKECDHVAYILKRKVEKLRDLLASGFEPTFEEIFEKALQTTPDEREKVELIDRVQGAKNVRVQLKYLREGRQMQAAIKQHCIDAATAAKQGKSAQTHLDQAAKVYRQMESVAKVQQKVLDSLKYEKNPTGDLKKVVDSARAYLSICELVRDMLTEVTYNIKRSVEQKPEKQKVGT
jgi:hypothetical protein